MRVIFYRCPCCALSRSRDVRVLEESFGEASKSVWTRKPKQQKNLNFDNLERAHARFHACFGGRYSSGPTPPLHLVE